MKFNKYDIIKMGMSAAVSAIILYFFTDRPPAVQPQRTERISWEKADQYRLAYRSNNPIIIEYQKGGKWTSGPWEGFKMDARAIDEIINDNKNGKSGNKKADELMIYFGKEMEAGKLQFRVIAAGVQNGVILKSKTVGDVAGSSIFDRADPCPPSALPAMN